MGVTLDKLDLSDTTCLREFHLSIIVAKPLTKGGTDINASGNLIFDGFTFPVIYNELFTFLARSLVDFEKLIINKQNSMSTSTDRRHQKLVGNDEMVQICGYDTKRDAEIQNVDDDEKSVMLKIITQIPVDPENRDDNDARETAEDLEAEDEYPDNEYRQRKAMLEQVLSEYDQQHQQEKKLYKNKIATLQRNKEQQKNQYVSDVTRLKDTMDNKLNLIEASIEETIEVEREERNASFREIEEHLVMRDNEVEGLLKIIAMQGDELEQAKSERVELKKEIQNVLLAFHVQFERYDEKGFKSNAELNMLREDHVTIKKSLSEEVSTLKQCMCMIQENIDKVQKETCEIVADTKNKITTAQKETQAQFHNLLDEQQTIVSGYLERNNDKFEKISTDMKSIRMELENHQILCEKLDMQQTNTNDRIKSSETAIIECRNVITELNDYVYNEAAQTMNTLISEKEDIVEQIQSLTETTALLQSSISEMNKKVNADKLDMEFIEVKLKDALTTLEQNVLEQERFLTTEINSTNESVKTVVEVMGSKLSDLRTEIHRNVTVQGKVNDDFLQKHQEFIEALEMKHKSIELSNQEVADMIETMKGFAQMHETLKTQFINAQAKHAVETEENEATKKGWHTKFDGLMKTMQQRTEVQSLASKDFKASQNDFELSMKSCCTQLSSLERRMTHAEGTLCNTVTSGLIDVMMQPYLNQNEQIDGMIKKQFDELKLMRDQMKTTQIDRAVITEKVDNMNQTWESLFQHLAGQMQKDTVDMNKIKKEVDANLNDVKRLTSAWEKSLSSVIKSQGTSQQTMAMIKTLQSDVESCNVRMTDLFHELERQQKSYRTVMQQPAEEKTSIHGEEMTEAKSKNELQASVERLLNV